MFKRCKVVPLLTNQKSSISFVFNTAYKKILSFKDSFSDNITFGEYIHLYILSDDKIKEGDWCYDEYLNDIFQANRILGIQTKNTSKKIIATTNNSLIIGVPQFIKGYLPQLSQSFIEKYVTEYNKGNVITNVLVEYENNYNLYYYTPAGGIECCDIIDNWQLKVSKDNTIIIKKVKDSWSKEELPVDVMLNLIGHIDTPIGRRKYHPGVVEQIQLLKKWIEENLNL